MKSLPCPSPLDLVKSKAKLDDDDGTEGKLQKKKEKKQGKQSKGGKKEKKVQPKAVNPMEKDTSPSSTYIPGKFQEHYREFVKQKRSEGHSSPEAQALWKVSDKRTSLLAQLPAKDLKRRRFDK